MAEATQYTFELTEVTKVLVKQQGLHEGKWMLAFEFNMGAGNVGPNPIEARPSAFIQIARLMLVKSPADAPDDAPLVVDAAVVNPRPGSTRSKK